MTDRWLPLAAAALAVAIVAPNLGGPGFWDPDELRAITEVGRGEFSARLLPALLGLLSVALVYLAARRVSTPRAGALAAMALATCPMFILHARLATSSMVAMVGISAVALGASGLRRRASALFDIAIAIAGLVACATAIPSLSIELGTDRAGFDWASGVEGIVYGAFPWIAIVLVLPAVRRHRPTGWLLLAAAAAWIASTAVASAGAIFVTPLLALCAGIALDRPRGRAPVSGVAALALAVALGRDLMRFPGKLAELGTGMERELAVDGVAAALPMIAGLVFGVAAMIALWRPRRTPLVMAAAAAFGLCFAHVWIPRVSRMHSQKHLFATWRDVRADPDEPIRLWRVPDRAAQEYAPGEHQTVSRAQDLAAAFAQPDVFAIAPGSNLCSVRASILERRPVETSRAGPDLFVLDGDWDSFQLLSSSLPPGHRDRSPLRGVLENIGDATSRSIVTLADGLEIIDIELPERARRGSRFEVVLRYRVTARPRRAWTVFAHFDGPGIRFQGDHPPVHKRCPSNQWMPGDIVTDRFDVKAGGLAHPRGRHRVWVGFFVGRHPNWTNLEVVSGERDENNRAYVGSIEIW